VRELDWRATALDPAKVLRAHQARTIVICNTVARAQDMASELRRLGSVRVTLLHSRFFQRDRREREQELRRVFGKDGDGGEILVATQVVEAGLDVSCEHLWTELCPMNALVQRAGRCARFEKEHGTVHVRGAASAPPYTQPELDAVAAALPPAGRMTPEGCREWVERVHAADDRATVQGTTLTSRLRECRDIVKKQVARIYDAGVSHLIREADDSVFVMIRREPPRKHLGYERSRIGRRGLIGALSSVGSLRGKAWKLTGWDEQGPTWAPMALAGDVGGATVACLHPDVCRYDQDGMRVGSTGDRESTDVPPPRRPGHALYRRESWLRHAEAVGGEALKRLEKDGLTEGIIADALTRRWGLNTAEFRGACHRAAALHDLGKLQRGWQLWARDRQQKLGAPCGAGEFLAHTDDGSVADELRRPPHASASAVIAERIRADFIGDVHELLWDPMLAAMVAHHGGWIDEREVHAVEAAGLEQVVRLLGKGETRDLPLVASARSTLHGLDVPEDVWPLASLMTRVVRLSDQRATADWCGNA
jgi:CRISPR-associated endonuclease/helicase Cas3